MYYQTESNIRNFNAWAGGNAWKQVVLNSSEDVIDYVDSHATETGINDFLWFDLVNNME